MCCWLPAAAPAPLYTPGRPPGYGRYTDLPTDHIILRQAWAQKNGAVCHSGLPVHTPLPSSASSGLSTGTTGAVRIYAGAYNSGHTADPCHALPGSNRTARPYVHGRHMHITAVQFHMVPKKDGRPSNPAARDPKS